MSTDTHVMTSAPGNDYLRQHRLLEQRVVTEEERLRVILDGMVDYAVISLDLNGLVTEWNAGASCLLGWTRAEILGRPACSIITGSDELYIVLEDEMRAAAQHGRAPHERWHLRRNGSRFWGDGTMMPMMDIAGELQGFILVLHDGTAQREAAEQRRADSEMLQTLLAASADCIKILDLDAKLVFMTRRSQRIMEIEDFDQIRECAWEKLWKGQANEDVKAAVRTARTGGIGHFRGGADTLAGTPKWWDVQVTPILGPDGRPERLLAVSRDITSIRLAELAFREADDRRESLLRLDKLLRDLEDPEEISFVAAEIMGQALNVDRTGYGTIDVMTEMADVRMDWTAPGMSSIAGLHAVQNYGSFFEDLKQGRPVVVNDVETDPRSAESITAFDAISIKAFVNLPLIERGQLVALLFVDSNRKRNWTAADIAFMHDVAERCRSAIERRRAEQDLRKLAASLEQQVEMRTQERDQLWNNARDLLVVADYNGQLLRLNPAWGKILGWDDNWLLSTRGREILHPDDLEVAATALDEMQVTGEPASYESRVRDVSGHWHTILWQVSPQHGGTWFAAIGRDMTERLRLEEQLRQSQKMEAVGQLTGGLAHDFNNLLTTVSGNLDMLSMRVAQRRAADVDRYVNAAQGAVRRAAALTQRLLAFSRRKALDPKPADVTRLVIGMQELIERTTGPGIELETFISNDLWTTLIDPDQFENALLNLCINARDAMPNGGKLRIRAENREFDSNAGRERELAPGQYVSLSVSDNGIGMQPDILARAFDPFFTTKPIGAGTGLGLSMIYAFARQSQGQARILSKPAHGTTVCLYLPRHVGRAATVEALPDLFDAPRARCGETVLVIDDDASVRSLVSEVLTDRGYTMIEAADGAAGLSLLHSDVNIDLLMTDVGLPGGMTGWQVAEEARFVRPNLKILFVTGFDESDMVFDPQVDVVKQVLFKPFSMEALATKIKQILVNQQ